MLPFDKRGRVSTKAIREMKFSSPCRFCGAFVVIEFGASLPAICNDCREKGLAGAK